MPAERLLPSAESEDVLALAREVARRKLAPYAAEHEEAERFPRDIFRTIGRAGLLSLAYDEQYGGAGQPYEVYLQALEELAATWASVALGVSVHTLSCYPLAVFGTEEQRKRWLPEMLDGELLGGYALSEPQAGSDAAAVATSARREGDSYVIDGNKAWITHGGQADYYVLFARTADDHARGLSCFLVPGDAPGLQAGPSERKMGLTASTTTQLYLSGVRVEADRLLGAEGDGLRIALAALDSGRLGIAACATGLAQAALDAAVDYAKERRQFGQRVIDFQGLLFLLADMAAAVDSARATYISAARRRDRGLSFSRQAAVAKLIATDNAMRVTTDAVQVFGGYGYTKDFPVERYMREAKVMQIFEGTNQIQRLVIGRSLARG